MDEKLIEEIKKRNQLNEMELKTEVADMKKELTMIEITKDREFLSELSALIKMNGMLNIANGRLSLSFQTENASIARRMYSLIKFFYNVHINISVRKKLKLKKPLYYTAV